MNITLNNITYNWGATKPPSETEFDQLAFFGSYPDFRLNSIPLRQRVSVEIANLKEATRVIVVHHYLHRGRVMAQLPYWICMDQKRVGVVLYSLPRLSEKIFGYSPMELLELARMWLHPDVQGISISSESGQVHTGSVASCAIGKTLRRVRQDWTEKYPNLPKVSAIISWADTVYHEGTIYKACNFTEKGVSGGKLHGNHARKNGGHDQLNPDYEHVKMTYLYEWK